MAPVRPPRGLGAVCRVQFRTRPPAPFRFVSSAPASTPAPASAFPTLSPEDLAFDTLQFESAVSDPAPDGRTRLVDRPELRHDHRLWARLLRFRYRVFADAGIESTWRGLVARSVRLPGDAAVGSGVKTKSGGSDEVHYLWSLFAAHVPPRELFEYAVAQKNDGGPVYSALYGLVFGRVVADRADTVGLDRGRAVDELVSWHRRFESEYYIPPTAFGLLVRRAGRSNSRAQVALLRAVYWRLVSADNGAGRCPRPSLLPSMRKFAHGMTDLAGVVPVLADLGLVAEACSWAAALRGRATPLMALDLIKPAVRKPELGFYRNQPTGPHWSRADRPDSANQLDQDLLARLFAIRAFSIGFLAAGLAMVTPEATLGPRVVRAIARRRPNDRRPFMTALKTLRRNRILLDSAEYTSGLIRLASRPASDLGATDMFARFVQSDQDPAEFDDTSVQTRLLTSLLDEGDVLDALPVLTALAIAAREPDPVAQAWNTVLGHQCRRRRVGSAAGIVDQMIGLKVPILDFTVGLLEECCLGPRVAAPGVRTEFIRPAPDPVAEEAGLSSREAAEADAKLFVRLLQAILRSDVAAEGVDPARWRGTLKRLGGLGCWDDVVALSTWLADWYRPVRMTGQDGGSGVLDRERVWSTDRPDEPARRNRVCFATIFGADMQGAIVVWAVRRAWRFGTDARAGALAVPQVVSQEEAGVKNDKDDDGRTALKYPEWGLIARFEADRRVDREDEQVEAMAPPDDDGLTAAGQFGVGINHLIDLAKRGVRIDRHTVRKSVHQALWTTYGAGVSARAVNRAARLASADGPLLEEVVDVVETAMDELEAVIGRGSERPVDAVVMGAPSAVYDYAEAGGLARQLVVETASRAGGLHRMSDQERAEKRGRLVVALFGAAPRVVANPVELFDDDGVDNGGVDGVEGDGHGDDDGGDDSVDHFWAVDRQSRPVFPRARPSRRIPGAVWRRAVDRWAVTGRGSLDGAVADEFGRASQ